MPSHAVPVRAQGCLLAALLLLSPPSLAQTSPAQAPLPQTPAPGALPTAPLTGGLDNVIYIPAEPQEVIGIAPDALPSQTGAPITGILAVRALGGTVVRLYDAGSGRLRREVKLPPEVITSVPPAISPDGKWLAVALDPKGVGEGRIGLLSTFRPVYSAYLESPGLRESTGFAFSPDGSKLAVANKNSYVQLWDLETRQRLNTFKAKSRPEALAFSPDGDLLMPLFRGQKETTLLRVADGGVAATLAVASGELLPGGLFVVPGGSAMLIATGLPLPLPAYLAGGARPAGFDRTGTRVLVTLPKIAAQPNATTAELREVMSGTVLARQVLLDVGRIRLMPSGDQVLLEGKDGLQLLRLR